MSSCRWRTPRRRLCSQRVVGLRWQQPSARAAFYSKNSTSTWLLALIGQSRDSDDATTVARRATLRELHDLLPGRAWDDVLAEHAVFDRGLLTMLLTALAVWARIAVRFGTDGDPRSLAVRERHRLELRELLGAGAGDGASVERWLACHTPEADVAAARQLATMIQRLGLSDPE